MCLKLNYEFCVHARKCVHGKNQQAVRKDPVPAAFILWESVAPSRGGPGHQISCQTLCAQCPPSLPAGIAHEKFWCFCTKLHAITKTLCMASPECAALSSCISRGRDGMTSERHLRSHLSHVVPRQLVWKGGSAGAPALGPEVRYQQPSSAWLCHRTGRVRRACVGAAQERGVREP